jgi:hypothetical protein
VTDRHHGLTNHRHGLMMTAVNPINMPSSSETARTSEISTPLVGDGRGQTRPDAVSGPRATGKRRT